MIYNLLFNRLMLFCFMFSFLPKAGAQQYTELMSGSPLLDHKYEFSGLAVRGDTLFLLAEKCRKIYMVSRSLDKVIDSIELSIPIAEVELEGLALFGDWIILLDEHKDNFQKIWAYNRIERRVEPLGGEANTLLNYENLLSGIEGIAVNAAQAICYVLQEKSTNDRTALFSFAITRQMGSLSLKFLEATYIIHDSLDKNLRFSDLTYEPDSRSLYLLRSHYDLTENQGKYFIDKIGLTQNGLFISNNFHINKIGFLNLSTKIDSYKDQFVNNIEGLVKNGDDFYLIADNAMLNSPNCAEKGKPALFIHIKTN